LAKLSGVRVISRTSVMQYKESQRPVSDIARELDVDGVIEGSVLRSGEKIRITTQLIDARTDQHVWAESYDRDVARVLEIQSEVARAVAAAIKLALSPEWSAGLTSRRQIDPRAQDAYFRGLSVRHVDGPTSFAAFEEANSIAPNYAAPQASTAANLFAIVVDYVMAPEINVPPEREMLRRAKEAALHAVELDDSLGDAHMALGIAHYLYDWDWETAESELRRGRELGTSDPALLALAPALFFVTGHSEEALAWMHDAMSVAP